MLARTILLAPPELQPVQVVVIDAKSDHDFDFLSGIPNFYRGRDSPQGLDFAFEMFTKRQDLKGFRAKLSKFFNNYNSTKGTNIKYLLIPELHKDGTNWHIHGLLKGLPIDEHLTPFALHDKLPRKMKKMLRDGHQLYNWEAYATKFGWVSVEQIRNPEAMPFYITKYISKHLGQSGKIAAYENVYYCSKGLKRAVTLRKGYTRKELDADFLNEYVEIKTLKSEEEALQYFEE